VLLGYNDCSSSWHTVLQQVAHSGCCAVSDSVGQCRPTFCIRLDVSASKHKNKDQVSWFYCPMILQSPTPHIPSQSRSRDQTFWLLCECRHGLTVTSVLCCNQYSSVSVTVSRRAACTVTSAGAAVVPAGLHGMEWERSASFYWL